MTASVAVHPWAQAAAVENRRSSARSRLHMLVRPLDTLETLWAWDIGMGGLKCLSERPRWPGSYLDLGFRLPGGQERFQVSAQVLSLDEMNDGLSLGFKFCQVSRAAQLAIYRFLDQRRALWSPEGVVTPAQYWMERAAPQRRPFAPLLLEAEASSRARTLHRAGFVRRAA